MLWRNDIHALAVLRELSFDYLQSVCADFYLWNAYFCVCIDYLFWNLVWSGDRSSHNAFFRTVVICAVVNNVTTSGFKGSQQGNPRGVSGVNFPHLW